LRLRALSLSVALVLLVLASLASSFAASSQLQFVDRVRTLYIVAVSTLPNGTNVGVYAKLRVEVRCPGHGHVYIETWPLTEIDTQASARVAAMVAAMVAGMPFSYCDYFASIISNSSIVGGPSASLAMAVAFAAALMDLHLDKRVVMTGMIMPDGSVGPVGGLYYKLHAAAEVGARLFLIPYGQINTTVVETVVRRSGAMVVVTQVPKTVNLARVGKKLGVEVKQVATVFQALSYATDGEYKAPSNPALVSRYLASVRSKLEPLVKGWISVETREINSTLSEFRVLWSNVSRELPGYVRSIVGQLVNETRASLEVAVEQGRKLEAKGLLYAAASRYFYALVLAKQLLYTARILESPHSVNASARSIIARARGVLQELERRLSSSPTLYSLSVAMDVAERAFNAIDSARRAIKAISSRTITGLALASYELGYADARVLSAEMWMELLNSSQPSSPRVSLASVWRASQNVIDYARTVGSYVYALATEIGVSKPSEIESANRFLEMAEASRNPIFRLTLAIEGLSYAYTALVKLFALPYTVSALNRSIETLMTLLIERSALPPDAALYLELAKLTSGSYALELYSRIAIRLASMLSLLLETEAPRVSYATHTAPRTVTVTQTVTRTSVSTVTTTRTVTSTSVATHTLVKTVRTVSILKYGKSYTAQWIATAALAIAIAALALGVAGYARSRRWEHGYAAGS